MIKILAMNLPWDLSVLSSTEFGSSIASKEYHLYMLQPVGIYTGQGLHLQVVSGPPLLPRCSPTAIKNFDGEEKDLM